MNSRFSTAVHILTLLASMPGERLTSEFIAASVGTNPVVIRRQLASLREAGLVQVTAVGTRHIYRLDPRGIGQMRDWLDSLWAVRSTRSRATPTSRGSQDEHRSYRRDH